MSKDKNSDGSRTQLILGILSFLGVLLGILASIFTPIIQERLRATTVPTQTPLVTIASPTDTHTPAPTDTVQPGEPTSTPAPTDTPVPTATFTATPIPIGQDWSQGCISLLWVVYPPAKVAANNGCLTSGVDTFYTTNGHLAFLYSGSSQSAEIHGLFAKLPNSGQLALNMNLGVVSNGEVLVGVFGAPDVSSKGALLVVPATNNPDKTKMFLKSMPGQKLFAQSSGPVNSSSGTYDLYFNYDSGEITVKLSSGQVNLGTVPALATERWLFIGYQVFTGGNNLKAEFFNLVIVK